MPANSAGEGIAQGMGSIARMFQVNGAADNEAELMRLKIMAANQKSQNENQAQETLAKLFERQMVADSYSQAANAGPVPESVAFAKDVDPREIAAQSVRVGGKAQELALASLFKPQVANAGQTSRQLNPLLGNYNVMQGIDTESTAKAKTLNTLSLLERQNLLKNKAVGKNVVDVTNGDVVYKGPESNKGLEIIQGKDGRMIVRQGKLTNSVNTDQQKGAIGYDEIIKEIDVLKGEMDKDPNALKQSTGIPGKLREEAGGYVQQLLPNGINEMLGTDPKTMDKVLNLRTRTNAIVPKFIQAFTGEKGSRISDKELALTKQLSKLNTADATASMVQSQLKIMRELATNRYSRSEQRVNSQSLDAQNPNAQRPTIDTEIINDPDGFDQDQEAQAEYQKQYGAQALQQLLNDLKGS